jgi:aminoglycoside phosphotransferase (APT) family kinase protein
MTTATETMPDNTHNGPRERSNSLPGRVLNALAGELDALGADLTDGDVTDAELTARLRRLSGLARWTQFALTTDAAREHDLVATVARLAETEADPTELGQALHALLGTRAETGTASGSRRTDSDVRSLPSPDTVTRYLRSARNVQDAAVQNVRALTGGFSKVTLLVEVTMSGQSHDLVIRQVPPSRRATSLAPEFGVLQRLYAAGLPVPEPLWIEPSENDLGGPFFVTRRSPGQTVGDVWGADAATKDLCLHVARLYAHLHQLEFDGLAAPISPRHTQEELHAMITWQEETLEKRGIPVPPELGALLGWLRSHLPDTPPQASLLHGDAAFSNLLVQDGRVTAMLDWEAAHVGHAAEELAYLRSSVEPVLPWAQFLDAYHEAGGIVPDHAAMQFFTVWAHTWRYIGCLWLRQTFDRTGQYESAVAAFVNGPRFLRDAVDAAFLLA